MKNKTTYLRLRNALILINQVERSDINAICTNVGIHTRNDEYVSDLLKSYLRIYPDNGGNSYFPIHHSGNNGWRTFKLDSSKHTFWEGESKRCREALCSWIIEDIDGLYSRYLGTYSSMFESNSKILLNAIDKILEEGPTIRDEGICANLTTYSGGEQTYDTMRFAYDAMIYWAEYSGDPIFPVGGERCYEEEKEKGKLWVGEGLNSRTRLLKHIKNEVLRYIHSL